MIEKFNELLKWIDEQPNWLSAIGHGLVCVGWSTIGLVLAGISLLADNSLAGPIILVFGGMDVGAYGLREIEDTRKGQPLGEGFEDFMGALVGSIAISVIYYGLVT